ncbi:hypothetical protein YC2023_007565 [Brassica napus]
MKHLSEHTATAYADALEVLGNDTPETILKKRQLNKSIQGKENQHWPHDQLENRSQVAASTVEGRALDFSNCGTPGKAKVSSASPGGYSSPSSYLLKSCRSERSAPVFTPPQTQPLTSYPPNLRNAGPTNDVADPSAEPEFPTLRNVCFDKYSVRFVPAISNMRKSADSSESEESQTPSSSHHRKDGLSLSTWLPSEVCSVYNKKGISKLYPWQAEHLEVLLEPLGKHVRSYYGNQGAVCTIEKANSLINRLLEEGRLSELGIIVIVLHMVGDQHRGYLLELMLTKLLYAAGEGSSESSSGESSWSSNGKNDPDHGLQIVGMSATMPNVGAVTDWLQAALYQTEFRPAPLEEYIKVGNIIYNKKMEVVRTLPKAADMGGKDPDHIIELCNELMAFANMYSNLAQEGKLRCNITIQVVQEGNSVLIFCSSRKGCESTARHIAKLIKKCL